MNFFADVVEQARARLVEAGYAVGKSETPEEICVKYFNVAKRRVRPQPRKVMLSKEFDCPPDRSAGFDELRRKAEQGKVCLKLAHVVAAESQVMGEISGTAAMSFMEGQGMLEE